jgi:hypothetical protein
MFLLITNPGCFATDSTHLQKLIQIDGYNWQIKLRTFSLNDCGAKKLSTGASPVGFK